jgi:hypothetical protein
MEDSHRVLGHVNLPLLVPLVDRVTTDLALLVEELRHAFGHVNLQQPVQLVDKVIMVLAQLQVAQLQQIGLID